MEERNAALHQSLKKVEANQDRRKDQDESDQTRVVQEAIRESQQKLQQFIEKHSADVHEQSTKEDDLKAKLGEMDRRNKLLTNEVKRLEEEVQVGKDKMISLGKEAEDVHQQTCDLLGRYERGQLSSQERILVMKVHDASQITSQRLLVEKNNEIARVRNPRHLIADHFVIVFSGNVEFKSWSANYRTFWKIENIQPRKHIPP
jgi:hypothetical protein